VRRWEPKKEYANQGARSIVLDKQTYHLGEGLYGLTELSRYVAYRHSKRADVPRTARWLSGALNPVDHRRGRPDYSFHDLISLFVIRELVAAGVKLSAIRKAEGHLRERLRLPRPFASVRLKTDGVNVLYRASPEIRNQLTAADLAGQEVLVPTIEWALRDVVYEQHVAVRWRPEPHVQLDPEVQFGEPCVTGTRIPTTQIAALIDSDETTAKVARQYGLSVEAVEDAVRFEHELAATT
jgi:uncharacterized protein (DUF433 family)